MQQAIFTTKEQALKFVAQVVVQRINDFQASTSKPFVLGLPTGSSPEGVYAELVQLYKAGKVSFKNVVTFNMDEYLGLPPQDSRSYHYFMFDKLFNHVDIPRENINILNGLAKDPEAECAAYEAKISKYGRINLFLGGVGPEGHLAFNEAGSTRESRTRVVDLVPSTIEANARFFDNDKSKVPTKALSVGISTILDNSEEIIILVFGKNKQKALSWTLSSKNNSKVPSTYLADHSNVLLVSDLSAHSQSKL